MVTILLVLKLNVLIIAGNWQEYVATVMESTAMIFKRKMATIKLNPDVTLGTECSYITTTSRYFNITASVLVRQANFYTINLKWKVGNVYF
jgi:hypothetical protein